MPSLRCPRCKAVVEVAPGQAPRCPSCGFAGGKAPAASATSSAAHTDFGAQSSAAPSAVPPPPATPPSPPAAPAPAFKPPSYEWAPPAPAYAPLFPTPAATTAPAPRRGWALAVLWILLVLDFCFESLWLSMVGDRATWESQGIEPTGAAIGILVALDVACRVVIGLLVATDLKALGAARLRLSTLPATSFERTAPAQWGVLSAIFILPCAVVLSMIRGRVRQLGAQAAGAPSFADRKQMREALKAPAYQETRKRQGRQTAVFFLVWIVMAVLSRI